MSFSRTLRDKLSERMQLDKINLGQRNVFLDNLLIMYFVIRASENLLRRARDETLNNPELKDYYRKHLIEETDHASWLAEDLKTANIDVKDFSTPKLIREMVGAVYYAIYHESSTALLGYMLVLENNQMPIEFLEKLEQIHGKALLRTLRYHIIHDKDHIVDILNMIDSCTIIEKLLIEEIAFRSAENLSTEFRALAA